VHIRFWAVIKLRSACEAELPGERMYSSHLGQGGDEHLTHALRPGPIQAGVDQRAPDAAAVQLPGPRAFGAPPGLGGWPVRATARRVDTR
jgi:hypothetical protein